MGRLRIGMGEEISELGTEVLLFSEPRKLHLIDPNRARSRSIDRRGEPDLLASVRERRAIRDRAGALALELDVVEKDEDVTPSQLVEETEPREEVRLMDADDRSQRRQVKHGSLARDPRSPARR